MPLLSELQAAHVDTTDRELSLRYIAGLPIPRDRREGYWRLYCAETGTTPTLAEIERVRTAPSP